MSFSRGRTRFVVEFGGVLGLLVLSSAVVAARSTPAEVCAVAKSKAAAKRLGAELKCWQKAISKGSAAPDAACLALAAEKFVTAIAKADDKGGCVATDDTTVIAAAVASCVDGIVPVTSPSTPAPTWYRDADGDGHGTPAVRTVSPTQPAGYVASGDDCDDTDPHQFPGRAEVCDGVDNDCDVATIETCCTVSTADFGDEGALAGTAVLDPGLNGGASDDTLTFSALLESGSPADGIEIALYAGYGAFSSGAITPGVYQLTGDELSFATCGVCVRIATNVANGAHDEYYMATGGTVTITTAGDTVGETLTGSLANVQFRHALIDGATGETTPAPDMCTSVIDGATFSATLQAAP